MNMTALKAGVALAVLAGAPALAWDPIVDNKQIVATPVTAYQLLDVNGKHGAPLVAPIETAAAASGNTALVDLGAVDASMIGIRNSQELGHQVAATNVTDVFWGTDKATINASASASSNAFSLESFGNQPEMISNHQAVGPRTDVPHAFQGLAGINETTASNTIIAHESGGVTGYAQAVNNRADFRLANGAEEIDNTQIVSDRTTRATNVADLYWTKGDVEVGAIANNSTLRVEIADATNVEIDNAQTSWRSSVIANSRVNADMIHGDFVNTSDATANIAVLDIEAHEGVRLESDQDMFGMVASTVNIGVKGVDGDFTNTNTARANVYSADVDAPRLDGFSSEQFARNDPRAVTNISATGIGGDFSSLTNAASNTVRLDAAGATLAGGVANIQRNYATVSAASTTHLTEVGGSVTSIAAATGNLFTFDSRR